MKSYAVSPGKVQWICDVLQVKKLPRLDNGGVSIYTPTAIDGKVRAWRAPGG